jgi:hypothetical protein
MGGLIFDKKNRAIGHISSPDRLTKESIEFWEKETGLELLCFECGERLKPGDQKDHYWPYFEDRNRCGKCLEKEKKRT